MGLKARSTIVEAGAGVRGSLAPVPERLSPSDMSSLLAERGPIHVHVGATLVVQGKAPAFATWWPTSSGV